MSSRIGYRAWQFWQSFKRSPGAADWNKTRALLTPPEQALFQRLLVPDQNHSLRVLHTLELGGVKDPDLLKAALLHDIGKVLHPLRRWERIFGVILRGIFPEVGSRWGKGEPRGIQRPLVVLQQHPIWGARLAEEAGSNQRVVWLIRHHEREDITGLLDPEGLELLQKLQEADNLN